MQKWGPGGGWIRHCRNSDSHLAFDELCKANAGKAMAT